MRGRTPRFGRSGVEFGGLEADGTTRGWFPLYRGLFLEMERRVEGFSFQLVFKQIKQAFARKIAFAVQIDGEARIEPRVVFQRLCLDK